MRERLLPFGIAAGVFLLDRVTKIVIRNQVDPFDTYTAIPGFFNIIHAENPGAAFSLFAGASPELRNVLLIGLAVLALLLIGFVLWRPGGSRALRTALALIMGGAFGNVYDRIVRGTVTDFLDFYLGGYHWPAFNAADTAITIGTALVLLDMLRPRRQHQADAT